MRLYARSRFSAADIALLTTEPFIHRDYRDHLFQIYEEVSRYLVVPTRSVMLTGSAFTGRSYLKDKPFSPGESDLDLAVVDRDLFRELLLCAARATRYFRDQTPFSALSADSTGSQTFGAFRKYAFNRGILRPELMPDCEAKEHVLALTRDLSNRYVKMVSSVSIFVYGDEEYFVAKVNNPGDR